MASPNRGLLDRIKGLFLRDIKPDKHINVIADRLLQLGIDARVAGKMVVVRGSPIASIRIEDRGDQDSADYYVCIDIPDHRLTRAHEKVRISAKLEKSFPIFGKVIDLFWRGNDLGLGVIDRLNSNKSLSTRSIGGNLPV